MMSNRMTSISFVLNGEPVSAQIQPHHTALDVLRNIFELNGARESCGQGLCGCCTVIVDGQSVSGCLYLAPALDGTYVETVESLEEGAELDPLQQAFIDCGAFQCGFCTSGFLLMAKQLLQSNPDPSKEQISNYLSGNLCRCGAYPEIIRAIQLAAQRMNQKKLEETA